MLFAQTPLPNITSSSWRWPCMFCLRGDVAKRHRKVGFHHGLEKKLVHGSGTFGNGSRAPWLCRFALCTLCRCKSFEIAFVLCCFGWGFFWACIQVAIMLFMVFKYLHVDLLMKGGMAKLGSSPEECHRSTAADKKLICWLAEDFICNRNAATYWIFSVRGVNLPWKI